MSEYMKIAILSISFILLQFLPVLAQQPTIEVLELAFEQIENTQRALNDEVQALKGSIQKNDTDVQKIKQNEKLGYLQRQRLESLLKESQTYSIQIVKLNNILEQQKAALQKLGNKLIRNYDLEINKYLKKLDDKSLPPSVQKNHYTALKIFRGKKSAIQEKTGLQKLDRFELNQLTIKPEDSPKKIEQKADLLKDQEDKYRKIGKQFDSRITNLKKELNLRNRIEDLVTDLALFDQQEEAIGDINTASEEALGTALIDGADRGSSPAPGLQNILVGQKDFDFNSLSEGDLEDVINKLEVDKLKAESKADSLANRAKSFYQKAESRKKR